jgi:hypothetical protein
MPYADKAKEFGFVPMNHLKPAYFEVGKVDVFDESGVRIPGYAAVKRLDTNDTLAIHSEGYQPVMDRDVFGAFEDALVRGGFDLTDMAVHVDRSHNGARMFYQCVIPSVSEVINGATVSLRFLMWNSHDGSRRASGRGGFYNWVCANQAVVGKDIDAFDITHKGDAAGRVLARIDTLVDTAAKASEDLRRMKDWAGRQIADGTVLGLARALPGSNKTLVGELLESWTEAKTGVGPNSGDTLWSFYNVLTKWSTHVLARTKNEANARLERQERVAKLMATKDWLELAT